MDDVKAAAERRRRCHEVWDDHELAMDQAHDRLAEIYGVSPIIDILDLQLKIAEDASVLADAYLTSPPRDLFDAVCEAGKRLVKAADNSTCSSSACDQMHDALARVAALALVATTQ